MGGSAKQIHRRVQYIFLYWLYDKLKELLAVVQRRLMMYPTRKHGIVMGMERFENETVLLRKEDNHNVRHI